MNVALFGKRVLADVSYYVKDLEIIPDYLGVL